jgi:hypothetical protein
MIDVSSWCRPPGGTTYISARRPGNRRPKGNVCSGKLNIGGAAGDRPLPGLARAIG